MHITSASTRYANNQGLSSCLKNILGVKMARIKIEEIIDRLDSEIRSALDAAVREVIPDVNFDKYQLFRAFKRAVGRKCNTWETIPDQYVEKLPYIKH